MQNRKITVSIVLKSLLGLLSLIAFFSEWATYGDAAPRLFGYWVMLFATILYFSSALYLFFHRRSGVAGCLPRLTALVVVNLLIIMLGALIFNINNIDFPTAGGFSGILICYIIPILALVDWLVFAKKGTLRTTDPWMFLAPSVIFASLIIITTEKLPTNYAWLYPYPLFDYQTIGLLPMVWLLLISVTLIVVGGYVIFLLDFAMSGELAKHIVLPKVKTVVVVEAPHPEISIDGAAKTRPTVQRKPRARGMINDITKISSRVPSPKTAHSKNFSSDSTSPKTSTSKTAASTSSKSTSSSIKDKKQDKKDKLANVGKLQPIKESSDKSPVVENSKASHNSATENSSTKKPVVAKTIKSDKNTKPEQNTKTTESNKSADRVSQKSATKKDEFKIPQPAQRTSHSAENQTKTANHPSTKTQDTKTSDHGEFKVPVPSSKHDAQSNSDQKNNQQTKQNSDKTDKTTENSDKNNHSAKNSDKNSPKSQNQTQNSSTNSSNNKQKPSEKQKIRHF